ncbi:MAG TPA: hypothetical protein VMW69_03985 [Spirochaetia bacterium]|nr:hypothetical protein [Spirochaetia bacterium]
MRYRDGGNVHKDFHLATNTTIRYVFDHYGRDFLRELFRRTAQQVYRDIYESLKRGDAAPLREHWEYYYEREGGQYAITELQNGFAFEVLDCPAVRHLKERGVEVTQDFYLQDILLNDAWSEGTPFWIDTKILGEGHYRMTVSRKRNKEKAHD